MVATVVLSGGITLIPMMIAAGLLLTSGASSGFAGYSLFSARAPKLNRLLTDMGHETQVIYRNSR